MIKQCVICDICGEIQLELGAISYKVQESSMDIRISKDVKWMQLDLCRRCHRNLIDFLNNKIEEDDEKEKTVDKEAGYLR